MPFNLNREIGTVVKTASGQELIDMAAPNYLGLANTERSKKIAIDTVRVYGVGTCGPAGFYGTLDIHLKLEKELARVLGTESAIIYAQGFAAVSSVIPAFSKRGDILVVYKTEHPSVPL
jgi:serine palmitoyltransferase